MYAYSKAVKRAKRVYQNRYEQLERELECPKRFRRTSKKMNVGKMKKQSRDLLRVYDNGGSERSGEEAIELWRSHFAKVLSGDDEGYRETSCTQVNTEETQPESNEHLSEPISSEEVQWAGSMEGSLPCGGRVLLCLYPRSRSGEYVM